LALEENFNSSINVSAEFIQENQKLNSSKILKKGGPYTKIDREKRRREVYKLHFEYGYPAIKIAEIMNVNRNTVNGDIDYWYSQVANKHWSLDPINHITKHIESLEIQRTRLREEIDKTKNSQERISIEHLILDIDSKLLQTQFKLYESTSKIYGLATEWLNNWMKKHNNDERFITWFDVISRSEKAYNKVKKILKEDRERGK